MGIMFETLRREDVERCVDMILELLKRQKAPVKDRKAIEQLIYGDYAVSVVAKDGDNVVGLVNGTVLPPPSINFFFVASGEIARKDVGGLLIEKIIEVMKKRSPEIDFIVTRITADDIPLLFLYLSRGFAVNGFIKQGIDNKDVLILRRNI